MGIPMVKKTKTLLINLTVYFLLLPFCVFSPLSMLRAQQSYRFEHINQNNGLSQGTINAIYQDKEGLMWFGTKDGLNRWDGKKMLVYRHDFRNNQSLFNNHILTIVEDNQDRMWLGSTGGGLFFQDATKTSFQSWKSAMKDDKLQINIGENIYCLSYDTARNVLYAGSNKGFAILNFSLGSVEFVSLEDYAVRGILVREVISILDDKNKLWVGTTKGGLLCYDIHNKSLQHYPILHERIDRNDYDNLGTIMDLKKDASGNIWVASFGDFVLRVDTINHCLVKSGFDTGDYELGSVYYVKSLAIIGDTAFWVATEYGFQVINIKSNDFEVYRFNSNDPKGISSNGLKTIYHDRNGGIWIGDNGFGINYYFPENKPFYNIEPNLGSDFGLTFKSVRAIYKDENGNLFVGGYGNLNKFGANGQRLWETDRIATVYELHPDPVDASVLWVGHEGGKLRKVRKSDGLSITIYSNRLPGENGYIVGNNVYSLLHHTPFELWIGTENGLNILNTKNDQTRFIANDKSDSTSLPPGFIKVLYNDNKKRLWVGSIGGGLAYLTDNNMHFRRFEHRASTTGSISSNIVYGMLQAKNGTIYVGTENGLNIFHDADESFTQLNTADGLANDVVYGLIEDNNGNIWLSTNLGISCYNPTTNSFRNYDKADGLQENEFNSNAYLGCSDGTMYFGGINGVTYFKPNELRDNVIAPKIIFTQLKIGNQLAYPNPPITKASQISLDYDNQSFSLEFAALNYYKPEKNQYAYRIQELQKDFTLLGNTNSIEIAHLGYGDFTVEVIASNNDNYWNNTPKKLHIRIPPPFWAQTWFRVGVVFLFLLATVLIYRLRIRSVEQKKLMLERIVSERTRELQLANEALTQEIGVRKKAEQDLMTANKTKDKFFSIIAHDLRSPFNALIGLTEILDKDFEKIDSSDQKEIISTLRQSMRNFYKLLENLLTWARNQTQKIKLQPAKIDLNELVEENCNILSHQAKQKNIKLISQLNQPVYVWADLNTTNTIIRNLLSNAIKFTYPTGKVEVAVEFINHQVLLAITDNGIGISGENLAKLFSLDEQFKQAGTNQEKGTGLGLILCKDFAEANGGTINVESQPGKGSIFTLILPASENI